MKTYSVQLLSVVPGKRGSAKPLPAHPIRARSLDEARKKLKESLTKGRRYHLIGINCAANDSLVAYVKA